MTRLFLNSPEKQAHRGPGIAATFSIDPAEFKPQSDDIANSPPLLNFDPRREILLAIADQGPTHGHSPRPACAVLFNCSHTQAAALARDGENGYAYQESI